MFLGLEWYWWTMIIILTIVLLPLKLKILKKMNEKGSKGEHHD